MIATDCGATYGSVKMFPNVARIEKINDHVVLGKTKIHFSLILFKFVIVQLLFLHVFFSSVFFFFKLTIFF